MPRRRGLIVVTPNFYVMAKLVNIPEIKLVILPGEYDRLSNGVISENTIKDLRNYSFSKAFMACTGVDKDFRVTTTSYYQRKIKQTAMAQAQESFLLVDSSKFDSPGLLNYCTLKDFKSVITDRMIAESVQAKMVRDRISTLYP